MLEVMTEEFGNPSSRYPIGQQAAARLKNDRAAVAAALGDFAQALVVRKQRFQQPQRHACLHGAAGFIHDLCASKRAHLPHHRG